MASFSTTSLTASGFTEAQAMAITKTAHASANDAIEMLRHELARWHVYLAFYLLIQIGIVLLSIILVQVIYEPPRSASAVQRDAEQFAHGSDSVKIR